MFKIINQLFLKGLMALIPLLLSLYVLIFVGEKGEAIFAYPLKYLLGEENYFFGMGLVCTALFTIGLGLLLSHYITSGILHFFMRKIESVPFVKTIYKPLRDLMLLFGGSGKSKNLKKVVMVTIPHLGGECIGLVTREEFSDIAHNDDFNGKLAVYVPMSYMMGGFTVIVAKDQVKEVNIGADHALKLAITGWIKIDKN